MNDAELHIEDPMKITQDKAPCVLHKTHSPVTVINELHHPFPQAWQKEIWGEVRDDRTVSICATGHNSIHEAQRIYERDGVWPTWCVGDTRVLAAEGFRRREAALDAL